MAMWRDPLDELIADLERAVPTAARPEWDIPRRWKTTASGLPGPSWRMNPSRRCAAPTTRGSGECRRTTTDGPLAYRVRTAPRLQAARRSPANA